jgi:hypothetical protein
LGGLGYVQSVRGPREVQFLGQGNDCVQVTYFNVGEQCSKLHSELGNTRNLLLPFVGHGEVGITENPASSEKFPKGQQIF